MPPPPSEMDVAEGDASDVIQRVSSNPFAGLKAFGSHRWSPISKEAGYSLESFVNPSEEVGREAQADVGVYFKKSKSGAPFGFEAKIIHANDDLSLIHI